MYFETDAPAVMTNGNCNGNNSGFFGGDWWGGIIGLIAVAAIFNGNNGLFGGGNGNNCNSAIQRGFDTQSIISKLDGINNGLCDGFYAMNTSMLNGFNDTERAICDLGYNLQNCCCQLGRSIDGVNYNLAQSTCSLQNTMNNNTRDIIQSQQAGTQRILDFLCSEKISGLQADKAALTSQLSQYAQTNAIVNAIRPTPVPSFPASNLYGYGYCNNNCGCGCGC